MYLQLALIFAAIMATSRIHGARNSGADLEFQVSPLVIVESITEEFFMDCRPSSSLEDGGNIGLMMDIYRHDVTGGEYVARQRLKTRIMGDNRTTGEGHMRVDQEDSESTYLSLTVIDPTFSEGGVYTCRYIYMDATFQLKHLSISANVSVTEIPPPEILPPVTADVIARQVQGSCCDDLREEIDLLKGSLMNKTDTPKTIVAPSSDESCRVSFSAKFQGERTFPIRSEGYAPFHEVISNKGGAYDVTDAAFVSPCDGQYYFTLTLRSQQELDSGYVDGAILVDGQEVARTSVFVDSPINNYESGTNGVIVTLKQGQKVKVQIKTTSFGRLRGSTYSIFSGFFLFA